MTKCPVCETQHTENDIETCSLCGYDLMPYPPVLGQIPPEFLEKEKKRILAAKRVWERSQMKLAEAEAIASNFQSQFLELLSQNISALLSQQEARIIEAIESRFKPIQDEQQKQQKIEGNSPKPSSSWKYTKLNDFLKLGNWKAADEETAKMMLAVARRTSEGWLDVDNINEFPCEDLRIIDHLWVRYSNGRFGFSVQKQIYLNCGGKPDGNYPGDKIWYKFCDEVGWRVNGSYIYYQECKFVISALRGHLPAIVSPRGGIYPNKLYIRDSLKIYSSLAQRLVTCSI